MTRNELLEIATAIYFLPSTIDNDTQRVIAESIAKDLYSAGVFNDVTMTAKQFVECSTAVNKFNEMVTA